MRSGRGDAALPGRVVSAAAWIFFWSALWYAAIRITQVALAPPGSFAVVAAGTGLIAGSLVVAGRRQFVLMGLGSVIAYAVLYAGLDLPRPLAVSLTIANVVAIAAYALLIRRFRLTSTGLGAPLSWAVLAACVAAGIRVVPVAIDIADTSALYTLAGAVRLALGTVVGLLAIASAVIALTPWRRLWPTVRAADRRAVVSTIAAVAVACLVLLSPVGAALPGAEFLLVPLAAIVAAQWPFRFTALMTAAAALLVAVSVSMGLGPFGTPALDADFDSMVISAQVLLIVLAITTLSLAAAVDRLRQSRRATDSALSVQRALYEELPLPVALVTSGESPRILGANAAFSQLAIRPLEQLHDLPMAALFAVTSAEVATGIAACTDLPLTRPDGSTAWVLVRVSKDLHDVDGVRTFRVAALEDVTTGRVSEELLVEQSARDPLTGMGNRSAFLDELSKVFADRAAHGGSSAIVLKVDGLRRINAGAGPDLGDVAIRAVAGRLRSLAIGHGEAFRISSSEFGLVVVGPGSTDAIALAERARAEVARPVVAGHEHLHVTARCGVVVELASRSGPVGVLRKAEAALEAGRLAGSAVTVFDTGDDLPARSAHALEQPLHDAVEAGALVAHFQPILDLTTGRIVGAEALVRLPDADGLPLPPAVFLPLATELGLMGPLTVQMLDHAVRAVADWASVGLEMSVNVNAEPAWLDDVALRQIDEILRRHRVSPTRLTIEITEEGLLAVGDERLQVLRALRGRGCHIAIDDFGTGYAGLDAFRRLPADVVKIDQSFIAAITHSASDRALVASLIDLIQRFAKVAVAEGVETAAQRDVLRELGCDRIQGFFIGRPVPVEDFPRDLHVPVTSG